MGEEIFKILLNDIDNVFPTVKKGIKNIAASYGEKILHMERIISAMIPASTNDKENKNV